MNMIYVTIISQQYYLTLSTIGSYNMQQGRRKEFFKGGVVLNVYF